MTGVIPGPQQPTPPKLTDALDALKAELKKEINCVRIGVIQAFDAANQTVTVKIAQQQVTSIAVDGTRTLAEYPLLLVVPVFFPSGGGFTLTFPIAAGDECVVLFNDRELDNWLLSGSGLAPNTGRLHDLSDGIALVGVRSNPRALSGVSTTTTQLRSDDGTTSVEVAAGGIVSVTAPTQINLNSPIVQVSGILSVQNLDGEAEPCIIAGAIQATGDIVAGTISLQNHVHTGVTTGGGETGGPVG